MPKPPKPRFAASGLTTNSQPRPARQPMRRAIRRATSAAPPNTSARSCAAWRRRNPDRRRPDAQRRTASRAASLRRQSRTAMRLLHARHDAVGVATTRGKPKPQRERYPQGTRRQLLPLHRIPEHLQVGSGRGGSHTRGRRLMAFRFGGEFQVERSPEDVYAFLTDPQKFCPLLPDFQSLTMRDATHFVVKLNVGISHIRGTAEIKMELAEADCPTRALYKGQGTVAGGNVTMTAGFMLAPLATGTRV